MPDRDGKEPADETTAPTEADEMVSEAEEQPPHDEETSQEVPESAEEAPVDNSNGDDGEEEDDPLALALDESETEDDEPDEEPTEDGAEPSEEEEEADSPEEEDPPEPPKSEDSNPDHLYSFSKAGWKSLPQEDRDAFIKMRRDTETLYKQAEAFGSFVQDLGLDDKDATAGLQLMSTITQDPAQAREFLTEHFPELVQPATSAVPEGLAEKLQKAWDEVDMDVLKEAIDSLNEAPAPAAPAKEKAPAPPPQPPKVENTAAHQDHAFWDRMSAATGVEEPVLLEKHTKLLADRVMARRKAEGKEPAPKPEEQERELLLEQRLYMAEQAEKPQQPKQTRRPVRTSRAPRAAAKAAKPVDPDDPLAIALG